MNVLMQIRRDLAAENLTDYLIIPYTQRNQKLQCDIPNFLKKWPCWHVFYQRYIYMMSPEKKNTLRSPLLKKKTLIAAFSKNAPKIHLDPQKSMYRSRITSSFRNWHQNLRRVRISGPAASNPSSAKIGLLAHPPYLKPPSRGFCRGRAHTCVVPWLWNFGCGSSVLSTCQQPKFGPFAQVCGSWATFFTFGRKLIRTHPPN